MVDTHTRTDNLLQRSEDWFASRRGKVTGSNVGAIMGVDPYRTSDDVMKIMVQAYLLGNEKEKYCNPAQAWGNQNEPNALALVSVEEGVTIRLCGSILHPRVDWFASSPDGLFDDERGVHPVEVKCPYSRKLFCLEERPAYVHQFQSHLECLGSDWGLFCVWTPEGHQIERVERDTGWFPQVFPVLADFHERFLEIVGDNDLYQSYLEDRPMERVDQEWLTLVQNYRAANMALAKAEAEKEKAREKLIEVAAGSSVRGGGLLVKLVKPKTVIDYKKACLDFGVIDLTPYTKPGKESWIIREV